MYAVGADDQVKRLDIALARHDGRGVSLGIERLRPDPETDRHPAFEAVVEDAHEIAAHEVQVAVAKYRSTKLRIREIRADPSLRVHEIRK